MPELAGVIGQARVELARSGRFGDLGGAAHWGTSDRQVREVLLGRLVGGTPSPAVAARLADVLAGLDPAAEDKRQACEVLLGLLARQANPSAAAVPLAGTPPATAKYLAGLDPADRAAPLAVALARLDPAAEDKRQAREVLLGLLARPVNPSAAARLADALDWLDPAAEDKRQAREVLLGLLAHETDGRVAAELADALAQLDPTVHDLRTWCAWTVRPTAELLAAVRRNSALTNWLAALPSLTSLSGPPA